MSRVAPQVKQIASVDGEVTALDAARVPLLDRGFLYGDSVYEVFRTYDGVPLFWREHFDRLENSARLIHMPIQQSREDMIRAIREAVSVARSDFGPADNGPEGEAYVRFHLSRGVGPIDLYPDPQLRTSFQVIVKPVPAWKEEHRRVGLRLAVTGVRRNADAALSPRIKSGNYLNNILALAEAVQLGGDDCLMLNAAGEVTESSNSNVWFVLDGRVQTAQQASGILRGLTGGALRRFADAEGWSIEETTIREEDLDRVEEAFVTSATREVMPVAAIRLASGEWRELPPGGGEWTRRAVATYQQGIAQYVQENLEARLW